MWVANFCVNQPCFRLDCREMYRKRDTWTRWRIRGQTCTLNSTAWMQREERIKRDRKRGRQASKGAGKQARAQASSHFCRACRRAAVKFSPETVHESCHGKCREVSGEISLLLVPQETKLENAQNFSRQISRRFSRDVLQLQMPNFMAFFILQTFVLESRQGRRQAGKGVGKGPGKGAGKQADKHAGRQASRQTRRQAGKQADKQRDRQIGLVTNWQARRYACKQARQMNNRWMSKADS